ncbi:deoxycytidyl transferase [Sporobolomyces koalae]|uniref:deoxycytidyl transferase n=1 Tax=Sporobolomyces koalae TaxID=500713 RepID=UPI003174168E
MADMGRLAPTQQDGLPATDAITQPERTNAQQLPKPLARAVPESLGGATGDYRDRPEYLPTGFGEIGQYLRNKRSKLQVQNKALLEDGKEYPQIFKGLNIYINGYTESIGLGELTETLVRHGGVYVPYLDRKALVTHILATNLTPTKRKEFASYKVATPDWIVESAKAGKLFDWRLFSLLAPAKADSPKRTGYEEEGNRLGMQTGQTSLFSMVGKKATGSVESSKPLPRSTVPSTSTNVETIESLSQRGARLARAVVLEQQQQATSAAIQSYFRPSSRPASAHGSSLPVDKDSNPDLSIAPPHTDLPAITDSPQPPNAITNSWLPQKKRDERTKAFVNDPEWLSKHTSASADFLPAYFAQSRLHHLSSFKEDLKVFVATRQAGTQTEGRRKLTGTAADGRTIFHVDFDCFFVSAGLTSREELRGKPTAVCHARGIGDSLTSTSEIASCSYEARAFGVKNGMSLGRARELCSDIQTMPFEFERYREFSLTFYEILLKHAQILQAVSMDEVLLEVKVPPAVSRDRDPALALAHEIRAEIFAATGCPASIGISHNITLARLATRKAKPASAYHLLPEEVASFLAPLDVETLPGIGYSLRRKLADELRVTTVGQLLKIPPKQLRLSIGKGNADKFAAYARGIDDRELEVGKPRKSVSAEVNYGIRFEKERHDQVERFMRELGEEVARRLRHEGLKARSLTLKVMTRHPDAPIDAPKLLGHGWVETENKQTALAGSGGVAVDEGSIIAEAAWKLMKSVGAPPHELRGIGLQLHKLEKDGQSVDVVREKGQSTLSFAAPQPTESIRSKCETGLLNPPRQDSLQTPAPITSAEHESAVLGRITSSSAIPPEVLVLDDSDSDSELVPAKPSTRSESMGRLRSQARNAAAKRAPYIPQIFKQAKQAPAALPSASQVTEEELAYHGIDLEVYRTLTPKWKREILMEARRSRPLYRPKSKKQLDPVATESSELPTPSVIVLSPSSPVAQAGTSEADFDDLDLPEDVRLCLPAMDKASQQAMIKLYAGLRVAGNGSKKVNGTLVRSSGPVRDIPIRTEPRFTKKVDIDEIKVLLEKWVSDGADDLHEADIERLADYLERCASRDRGHSLSKAVELLTWWKFLLEDEFGPKVATADGARGRAWWEGYERTVERVTYLVKKETSCALSV